MRSPTRPAIDRSLRCAAQREGVLDALLEDLVGELPIGKRPRQLNRADHRGEDGEHCSACRLGSCGARRAASSSVEMSKHSANYLLTGEWMHSDPNGIEIDFPFPIRVPWSELEF